MTAAVVQTAHFSSTTATLAPLQGLMVTETVELGGYLSQQQRSALLQHDKLKLVMTELAGDNLTVKGYRELVYEVLART